MADSGASASDDVTSKRELTPPQKPDPKHEKILADILDLKQTIAAYKGLDRPEFEKELLRKRKSQGKKTKNNISWSYYHVS
jgi:hypothetical protein